VKELFDLLGLERLQIGTVPPWNDHEVAVVVRESVHHDERIFPSMEDEIFFISFLSRYLTEETPAFLPFPYIGHPPWGPNLLHPSSFVTNILRGSHRMEMLYLKRPNQD
jgi:hypothetical protein